MKDNTIIYGAAYYDEYQDVERLEKDVKMMAEAGINTVRIAESTWSLEEPEPGKFDFSSVDRVLDMAEKYGINVIIGTPTYAIPYWLVKMDPDVLYSNEDIRGTFGWRQNMNITNKTYLHYAERIIRKLVSHVADRPNVIGFQIDNETKHYQIASYDVLDRFRGWLKQRFGTIEALNKAYCMYYWSESVTSFEDLPNPTHFASNGSYACAFAEFQRELVNEFLQWQADIVSEYKREDQFITNNQDYEWTSMADEGQQMGYGFGVQPDCNHYEAAKALTVVGADVYCYAQAQMNGLTIAYAGDEARSIKHQPYLILESQGQAFLKWLPYPGQLRLMAWSHIASGAMGVMYWPWMSLRNGVESYWKGILSHDGEPNVTYRDVSVIGHEFEKLSPVVSGLKKTNRAAIVVSNEANTALQYYPTNRGLRYNDVVKWLYQALYELNIEVDVIFDRVDDWSGYDLLFFPELYCVKQDLVDRVREFVANGGTVFSTFRSFYTNEHETIYPDRQPHGLTDVFGMTYDQYTDPIMDHVTVDGAECGEWMELLRPDTAESIANYTHRYWGEYAAVTRNQYKKGTAWYVGTMVDAEKLKEYLLKACADAGIQPAIPYTFPMIARSAVNKDGKALHFLMNYSDDPVEIKAPYTGLDHLTGNSYQAGEQMTIGAWDLALIEE